MRLCNRNLGAEALKQSERQPASVRCTHTLINLLACDFSRRLGVQLFISPEVHEVCTTRTRYNTKRAKREPYGPLYAGGVVGLVTITCCA